METEAKMAHFHVPADSLQAMMLIDDFMHSKGYFVEPLDFNTN